MSFFWWLKPWSDLLGRERSSAKPGEPVKLAKALCDWGIANPAHRQAAGRIHGALKQAGFKNLQDLQITDTELLEVRGIGEYGLKLIREMEGTYGSPTK